MTDRTCSTEGCEAKASSRGWCARHYAVWYRTQGGPLTPPSLQRFMAKVQENPSGCWVWVAGLDRHGYGRFKFGGRVQGAHRVAWLLMRGPIPDGMHIDHLCRNPSCVNPDHLEPVTKRTNTLRGISGPGTNSRKTHCISGHEFTPENTRIRGDGGRLCRACKRSRERADRERRKQER